MPFGLTNLPSTFMRLMHHFVRSIIRKYFVVYFDDILVFNMIMHEHVHHLRAIFKTLRNATLFVNKEKWLFWND